MIVKWETYIGLFMLVGGLAAFIDFLLKDESIRQTQDMVTNWQRQLSNASYLDLMRDSNHYINLLFNSFYGMHHFSRKTFLRSVITSMFAIGIFLLILSVIDSEYISDNYYHKNDMFYVLLIIIGNIIADYFSLIETRILLRKSEEKPIWILFLFLVFDVMFSFFCYYLFCIILFCIIPCMLITGNWSIGTEDILSVFKAMSEVSELTPFVWSTFFTSILFYVFIINAIAIKVLFLFKLPMTKLFKWYANTQNPAKRFVALFAAFVLILEGIKRLI